MVVKNKAFQGTGTDLAIFTQAQGAVEHPSHKGESKSQHQAKVDDQLCAVMQNIISHFIRQNGLNFLRGCAPEQVVVETNAANEDTDQQAGELVAHPGAECLSCQIVAVLADKALIDRQRKGQHRCDYYILRAVNNRVQPSS